MRTATANFDLLARTSTAEAGFSNLNSHGASVLGTIHAVYSALVGKAEVANLPAYLVADAFGEQASRRAENHVRDGFGRPIY